MGRSSLKLSDKQELFCQEYLKDLNATQAARRAKYSDRTAHKAGAKLMSKAHVVERIQSLMNKRSAKLEITADKVLKDIEDVRVRCMQGEPVLDREGHETGEWKFEAHAALKASELQGKHIKMFSEKVDHSVTVSFEHLSDPELDALIDSLLKKIGRA